MGNPDLPPCGAFNIDVAETDAGLSPFPLLQPLSSMRSAGIDELEQGLAILLSSFVSSLEFPQCMTLATCARSSPALLEATDLSLPLLMSGPQAPSGLGPEVPAPRGASLLSGLPSGESILRSSSRVQRRELGVIGQSPGAQRGDAQRDIFFSLQMESWDLDR